MIVWRYNGKSFDKEYCHDMEEFDWLVTSNAGFSPSDDKLLVAGHFGRFTGEIAIFKNSIQNKF